MPPKNSAAESLQSDNERLKIENLLLRQATEFTRQLQDHIAAVDKRISAGKFQLGLVGLAALALAWLGSFEQLSQRVEKRLDVAFGSAEIEGLISDAADRAALQLVRERLATVAADDSNVAKCLIDRLGSDLFLLQCAANSGDVDTSRGFCITSDGAERSYMPAYPDIECDLSEETPNVPS